MLTLFAGCGADDAPASGPALQIGLIPAPGGINGDYLQVQLADASGAPITDAQVALEGNMTHAGMVPVTAAAVTDDADGSSDGTYQLPFQFSMLGDWIITVDITLADGTTVTRDIEVTAGADAIEVPDAAALPTDHDHAATSTGLTVEQLVAYPAPLAGGNGALYLTIANPTDQADQLTSVTATIAQAAEMHESINDNNVMRMESRPEGFAIPAGGQLELTPNGKHVMLMGLTQALAVGDTFTATLTFAHAPAITLPVTVAAMGAAHTMDHSGHTMADTPTKTAP
jgi:periplasmic copper chaperone A